MREVKSMYPQEIPGETIVSVDPGREKCGIAVITSNLELILKEIVSRNEAAHEVLRLAQMYNAHKIIIGDRTGSEEFASDIMRVKRDTLFAAGSEQDLYPEIIFVDEHKSSMEGRHRYLLDNPPKGLGRLIPISLRTPGKPFDDYVAVILAERFFQYGKS